MMLEAMVQAACDAGVGVVLVNGVSNLKDSPPFKSEFDANVSALDHGRVVALWEEAEKRAWSDAHEKARLLAAAAAIDGRHAGLLYVTGKCYERMGRFARSALALDDHLAEAWIYHSHVLEHEPTPITIILGDLYERRWL